jgi:hypothetical protein
MKTHICLYALLFCSLTSFSQYVNSFDRESSPPKFNVGLGIGLDYGGIGGRVEFLPVKQLGLFAGLGYPLVDFGYNLGARFRVLPDKRICPSVGVMYGYNGVIKVQNMDEYNKLYYGPSMSGGVEIKSKNNSNFFNIELVLPFRDQSFYDDWDKIKQLPNMTVKSEPIPLAFSIGYHFALE